MIVIGMGNWSLQTKVAAFDNNNTIEGISISEIMEEFTEDKIDVLKIDIEGAGKELFDRNYQDWLPKTKIITIELHDNLDNEISAVFYKALEGISYKKYFNGENLICEFVK